MSDFFKDNKLKNKKNKIFDKSNYDVSKNIFINCDCMELISKYPDKYFNLVLADPPYNININKIWGSNNFGYKQYDYKEWDNNKPDKNYFDELFRISKNQIVWGGQLFYRKSLFFYVLDYMG